MHAAYWKYVARRRLLGDKRGSFSLEGSNWFRRPEPGREWSLTRRRQRVHALHRREQRRASHIDVLDAADAEAQRRLSA